MTRFSVDDLHAGLLEAQQLAASTGSSREAEKVARAQRWLGLGGDADAFAAIATELEAYVDEESEPWQLARIAGLWHLAGDGPRARGWCERVARERRQEVAPWVRAGVLYLQGEYKKASRADESRAAALLANIAHRQRIDELAEVRAQLVQTALVGGGGPHDSASGDPLTAWDWVEESFLLEARLTSTPVPSGLDMLRSCGVLVAATSPPSQQPACPELGLRQEGPHGESLRVSDIDWVEIEVPPTLHLVLREEADLWGAWMVDAPDSSGAWIVDPVYPDWRHAGLEAARWVEVNRGQQSGASEEAQMLRDLLREAAGDPGEPMSRPGA